MSLLQFQKRILLFFYSFNYVLPLETDFFDSFFFDKFDNIVNFVKKKNI